ncbi:MAG: outer membrane protein assembly factor BamD [Chlorobium sp.]|nr:MAG: outer membrane protein assembly factor BamD [Chlorobium sp.]
MSGVRMFARPVLALFVIGILTISGCSSTKPAGSASSKVKEDFAKAQTLYDKRKYDEAALKLESLIFTSRATALEGDVLFLLAQSYYNDKQYLLAADSYSRLLKQVPSSRYAKAAQFMLAKSYEKLSPQFELDQQHSVKAIEQFSLFLELYPEADSAKITNDLETYRQLMKVNPDNPSYRESYESTKAQFGKIDTLRYAAKAIPVLKEKLAKHSFFIAKNYVQLKKYRAAGIYYDEIIRRYPDSSFIQQAWTGKIDMLVKRKKWFDASQALDLYLQIYPEKQKQMQGIREKISQNLKNS